eukprot:gene10633-11893_t
MGGTRDDARRRAGGGGAARMSTGDQCITRSLPRPPPDEEQVQRAVGLVSVFAFVGIMERWQESMCLRAPPRREE